MPSGLGDRRPCFRRIGPKTRTCYTPQRMIGIIPVDVGVDRDGSIWSKAVKPVVVIGRHRRKPDGTGVGGIGRVAGGIISGIIVLLLIQGLVTGRQSCSDQDKLDAG